jgi:hypothetical protein
MANYYSQGSHKVRKQRKSPLELWERINDAADAAYESGDFAKSRKSQRKFGSRGAKKH